MCSSNSSAVENKRSVDGRLAGGQNRTAASSPAVRMELHLVGSLLTRTPRAVCHPPQAALSQSHNPCLRSLSDSGRICQLCNGNLQEAWPREKKRQLLCSSPKSTSPHVKRHDGEDRAAPDTSATLRGSVLPTFCQQLLPYSCGTCSPLTTTVFPEVNNIAANNSSKS